MGGQNGYIENKLLLPLSYGLLWQRGIYGAQRGWVLGCFTGRLDNIPQKIVGGTTGWTPILDTYGDNTTTNDSRYQLMVDGAVGGGGGMYYTGCFYIDSDITNDRNAIDAIEFNGTIYIAGQHYLYGLSEHGNRGSMIFYDAKQTEYYYGTIYKTLKDVEDYETRGSTGTYGGGTGKCFAKHNNNLYMLSNDGTVYQIYPGKAVEVADLTALGTFSSSGVFGGSIPYNASTWTGNKGAFRPFLTSFNNQLHAFLNFRTDYKALNVAGKTYSTDGKGIFWATSFDGRNWSDFSYLLPSSGIVSASGKGLAATNWKVQTSPYWFSAMSGPNNIGASGGYDLRYLNGIGSSSSTVPAQPSGFTQTEYIQFLSLVPSGDLVFDEHTKYSSLPYPLSWGVTNRFIYPTETRYPPEWSYYNPITSGWEESKTDNNVLKPTGTPVSGYDYTGCHNYHISGATDEEEGVLRLLFTEDYQGESNTAGRHGSTSYYTLNKSSGWILRNFASKLNQVQGFVPCGMYDPQIFIPSGEYRNTNPRIDLLDKKVYLDYYVYDWPYWNPVDIIAEYSIDNGETWKYIGKTKNVSTGSEVTDPSGMAGQKHTYTWNYLNTLGKNNFYPNTKLRLRAVINK